MPARSTTGPSTTTRASAAGNGRVLVFWNDTPNANPSAQERRWMQQHDRRIKQNWNYDSP